MAEYIDKDRAYQTLADEPFFDNADRDEIVLPVLAAIPADDVAPVVHGRWIPFHSTAAGDIQYCSVCKIGNAAKSDFCPNCGAKMDGGGADG